MSDRHHRPPRFLPALVVCLGSLPWAILVFTILVTGLSLGAGLLITLAGAPILAGTLHLAGTAADLECTILRWATDADARPTSWMPTAGSRADRRAVLRDPRAWREFVLLVLRLPLGIVTFTLTVALITMPAAYLTAPLTYRWVTVWSVTGEIESRMEAVLAIPLGLLLAAVAAVAIPAMARLLARSAEVSFATDVHHRSSIM